VAARRRHAETLGLIAFVKYRKTMEIIIVRHGLSEANVDGSIGTDSSLADKGRQQAEELASKLKDEGLDVIFCSPLKRCIQTAEPISRLLSQKPVVDPRLKEVDWGTFDGKTKEEVTAAVGMPPKDYLDTYAYDFTKFGGENYKDMEKRLHQFLDDLKGRPYKKILVVTHGAPVRMLNYLLTGQKIKYQPNATVIRHNLSKVHLLK
jgi:broad specificity phosphatase PhoE